MSDSPSDSGGKGTIKKKKCEQRYQKSWEKLPEFKGWLTSSKNGNNFGKCKYCNKDINISSGRSALRKHSTSQFHQKNKKAKTKTKTKQSTLTSFATGGSSAKQLNDDIKEGEIRLSAFLAEHNLPFSIMDHLVKTIAKVCHDSNIAKGLACGRTKSTAIVKNVLGQDSFKSLCTELQSKKFSLIVDESTDRTVEKHLSLVVRHFENDTYKVKDDFLGMIKLTGADSITLYNHITTFFQNNKIPYKENLLGFASDGANVMMGEHHSLMSMLKNDVPSLFVMKCIYHSFHLCASCACHKLPRSVEDLIRDIYNYFGSSTKRVSDEFSEFENFCNVKIHKILHPSQTRWLSVHSVVARILEQYRPLQLYFKDAAAQDDVLAAKNILRKLDDPTVKLFLEFLDFVLPFFNNLNQNMQSESPRVHVIYKNVCNVLKTIFDCFIKRNYLVNTPIENIDFKDPGNHVPIEEIYFGGNVGKTIESESKLSTEQLRFFRVRCLDFYVEACSQIVQRFPLKNNPLKLLEFLDPEIVKSGSVPSIATVAVQFSNCLETSSMHLLDNEWRLLRNTEKVKSLSNDVCTFWKEVGKLKQGDETPMFPTLTNFVFKILCLPHSSATVERVFSAVNLMKTKVKNKLNTDSICALLHTKRLISNSVKNNCYEFLIEKKLINSMTSENLNFDQADQ